MPDEPLDYLVIGAGPAGLQLGYFLGKEGRHPESLPATVAASLSPVSPFIEGPFRADRPGFYVLRHRGARGQRRDSRDRIAHAPFLHRDFISASAYF